MCAGNGYQLFPVMQLFFLDPPTWELVLLYIHCRLFVCSCFKGRGEGPRSKKVFLYPVTCCSPGYPRSHLSPNSKPLPRYGLRKIACFQAISAFFENLGGVHHMYFFLGRLLRSSHQKAICYSFTRLELVEIPFSLTVY